MAFHAKCRASFWRRVGDSEQARVEIVVLASDVLDLPATSTPVRFGRDHDWR
jgi:hypothetical protein